MNNEFPRSGLPPAFCDEAEYQRVSRTCIEAGYIRDESFFWWALRPSRRFPTLEVRICGSCTLLVDSLAISALCAGLIQLLLTANRAPLPPPSAFSEMLIEENRWQTLRYGMDAQLVELKSAASLSIADTLNMLRICCAGMK